MPRSVFACVALAVVLSGCPSGNEECLDDDCGSSGTGGTAALGGTGGTGGTGGASAAEKTLVGDWIYSSSSYPRTDGSTAVVSISGELTLRSDGQWNHNRRIGGISASGRGTYTVAGSRITLKHDDGSSNLTYDFFVGTETDAQSGRPFKALTLNFTDGSGYKYLLVEKTN